MLGLVFVKLSRMKGFSMIEVLCSLMIISIALSYVFHTEMNYIKTRNYLEARDQKTKILEAVVTELTYNCSYQDISNLSESGKVYISKENLNLDNFMNSDIKTVFSVVNKNEKPYISLYIIKDKVIKVTANMYFKLMNKEEMIKCDFYKGNY